MPEYPKMPSGMILTVLAAKNFKPNQRDDISFIDTIQTFFDLLEWLFQIKKPVDPFNNLSNAMSQNEIDNFMDRTDKLLELGNKAIESKSVHKSREIWTRVFGDRFNYTHRATLIG